MQRPAGRLEPERLLIESISLVNQKLNLFSALQDFLNVLHHNPLDVFNLTLDGANVVDSEVGPVRVVKVHALPNDGRELLVHTKSDGRLRFFLTVPTTEPIHHVGKEGVGDPVFVLFIRHAEVANAALDNVVKDVVVVDIGHFAVMIRDLGQQHPRDGREVACCFRHQRKVSAVGVKEAEAET